ncbi:hypothetical protein [Streptomyces sp. NPDC056144]|uniref:hypothetical protein n=1 Tax=unclassified Streptomyces TaxID=2593676 RepID=UPI0035DE8EA1
MTSLLRPGSGATALALAAGLLAGAAAPAGALTGGTTPTTPAPGVTPSAKAPTAATQKHATGGKANGPIAPGGIGKAVEQEPAAVRRAQEAATDRARVSGKTVPVETLTTESTRTVANPDGSFTMTQNAEPVRARKGRTWVPVDTTLGRRADGRLAPAASVTEVSFSGDGTGPLVTMVRDGKKVSLDWPGELPAPVVAGDTATYRSVLPDVDLAVTANADGFRHVLVVKTAEAAADPALANLRIGTDTEGVSLSENGSGDVVAKDKSGRTVFQADPPLVWDSSAKGSGNDRTRSSVRGPGAGAHHTRMAMTVRDGSISLVPGKELLKSPDVVYPLYIDPVWQGYPSVTSWASINSMGWKATSGTEARVGFLGNWEGCGSYCNSTARSWFSMNVDGIRGGKVTSASFRPFFFKAANSVAEPTEVWLSQDIPGNLAWNSQPGDPWYIRAETSCKGWDACGDDVVPYDVQAAAQGAADGGRRTFMVKAQNESDKYEWKKIDPTKTYWTVTYFLRPYINNDRQTTPTVNAFGTEYVNSRDVTMRVTGGSPTGEKVATAYEIWNWSNGQPTSGYQGGLWTAHTANGGSFTYSGLPDGTYAWRGVIHSEEGDLWSNWSDWSPFTVDTTAPPTPTISSLDFPRDSYGGAYSDQGTFDFTTHGVDNVAGYVFSLDGDLGSTAWSQQSPPQNWDPGQPLVRGKQYWVSAGNASLASVRFAPGVVGPHWLNVKAVDKAGHTSAQQGTHGFYAGLTRAEFVHGNQLVSGYTRDSLSTSPATWTTADSAARVIVQNACCPVKWGNDTQAMLAGPVSVGDTAVFRFIVPKTGYWTLGANVTQSYDYGRYSITFDQGTGTEAVLASDIDGYNGHVTTAYRDFGPPKRANGKPIELARGVHTLTVKVTGKNAASGGHQVGIDTLRVALMSPSCTLTDLTDCRNNIAVSPDANHDAADADGGGISFSARELTEAGWAPGTALTINGAPMKLPSYGDGKADNILSSGQTITVDTKGAANSGNALVFLAFATAGTVEGASGSVTYEPNTDGSSPCGASVTHPYTLDTVPDWVQGDPKARAAGFATRNLRGGGTDPYKPQLFAVSVALPCPGLPIKAIRLPVVTDQLTYGTTALHVMGVGIRTASYVPDMGTAQNWNGTWGANLDSNGGTLNEQTVRIPARVTVGNSVGGKVRIRLSNAVSSHPVTLPRVSIARQGAAGTAATEGTPIGLTFGGSTSVTIPSGSEVTSDPVTMEVVEKSTLLVSLNIGGQVPNVPVHNDAQAPIWTTAPGSGDHTADTEAVEFTGKRSSFPYLAAVDVTPTEHNNGALALYGDQTVNSDTTTGDNAHHLSDLIYDRVSAEYAAEPIENPKPYGVLNLGRNSWNVNNNLLPALSGSPERLSPPSATNPVDRVVLSQANVRKVLISTGASDILNNASATDIQQRLSALAQQIRQRYVDEKAGFSSKIDVQVATIPHSLSMTAGQDTVRRAVNNYILCGRSDPTAGACTGDGPALGGNADGSVDFAAAVSADGTATGPLNADRYLFTETGTGKRYPNQRYYEALAERFTQEVRGI